MTGCEALKALEDKKQFVENLGLTIGIYIEDWMFILVKNGLRKLRVNHLILLVC